MTVSCTAYSCGSLMRGALLKCYTLPTDEVLSQFFFFFSAVIFALFVLFTKVLIPERTCVPITSMSTR